MPRPPLPPELLEAEAEADHLRERIKRQIAIIFSEGFWYCKDCDHVCERHEGEQGQPACCGHCASHRIEWHAPIGQAIRKEGV